MVDRPVVNREMVLLELDTSVRFTVLGLHQTEVTQAMRAAHNDPIFQHQLALVLRLGRTPRLLGDHQPRIPLSPEAANQCRSTHLSISLGGGLRAQVQVQVQFLRLDCLARSMKCIHQDRTGTRISLPQMFFLHPSGVHNREVFQQD